MRWIGVRSYGIYLWHYPIIVLTTPANSTDSLARGALQVAASIVVAALSWHFVEEPIRHGALAALVGGAARPGGRRRRSPARRGAGRRRGLRPGVLGLAGACLAGLIPAITPAGDIPASPGRRATATPRNGRRLDQQLTQPAPAGGPGQGEEPGAGAAPRTSCRSVVHIGDSTSDGLNSPDYLPNRALRLPRPVRRRGRAPGAPGRSPGAGRSSRRCEGQPNAATVAQQLIRHGYQGCWVLALGTNDTADVFVGSKVGVAHGSSG